MIPGSANPLLLRSAAATGYQIQRSLRFNSSDSAYLSKTYSTARSGTDCTLSFWIKRHKLGTDQVICATARSGGNQRFLLKFLPSDRLHLVTAGGGYYFTFHPALRDCSAWYHIHWKWDTRDLIWINGVQYSSDNVGIFGGHEWHTHVDAYSNVMQHGIGYHPSNIYETPAPDYGNYTLAEFHSLDNINAPVSSFGETNATTGQWVPKAYTGGYGNNGFRLTFSDNSGTTASTLGKDAAGSNNWTPTNFSVASGAGNDSLVDTPTSYGTDTGAGGEVRGNYCTWNPLNIGSGVTLSDGNLKESQSSSSGYKTTSGTVYASSGKWYAEFTVTTGVSNFGYNNVGVVRADAFNPNTRLGLGSGQSGAYSYGGYDGKKYNNGAAATYGAAWTSGTIGCALDLDAGTVTFYKDGVSQGVAFSSLPTGLYTFACGEQGEAMYANFGQRPFAYTAPSGFKALCDTNLPAPVVAKPNTVMDVKLWTGNGGTQTITTSFSPDFVWVKQRDNTNVASHVLVDIVRGNNNVLRTNGTDAENGAFIDPTLYDGITNLSSSSFDAVKGSSGTYNGTNGSGKSYVGWIWDAGSSTVTLNPGDPGSGSITSQVRANASAGFSVVTWTGNGVAGATVGHGLGTNVALYFCKNRSTASNWVVIGHALNSALGGFKYLQLNTTAAASVASQGPGNSSTIELYNDSTNNTNGDTYVAYCFAPVAGYSAFGSYTGNGSTDGPFVFCNFRPRWILIKKTDSITVNGNWLLWDTARGSYNVANQLLIPNLANAEDVNASYGIDVVSNGFKLRATGADYNNNSSVYIYAAFAENPFQYARAR